jgi:anti-sigma regulatory factor (Ser/Thr protein kinase)
VTAARPEGGFCHDALLYAGEREFVDATARFVRDGVAADEPVLVVVGAEKIAALRSSLGPDADAVCFADMAGVGGNPARIIPVWRRFVNEHGREGRPVRGVGEPVYPERSPDELVECQQHEVLLNLAFADSPAWWLVCPYDVAALDPGVVKEAYRSHPFVMRNGHRRTSPEYRDAAAMRGPFDDALPPPPGEADELVLNGMPLTGMRQRMAQYASAVGLDRNRADDLVLAVDELVANSIRHGGGNATLRVWQSPTGLICEVEDSGRIYEPLVGRSYPTSEQDNGWGLWLVNQLCDLVQLRSSPDGTVVRLHMHRR